jgi:hypothetical protein
VLAARLLHDRLFSSLAEGWVVDLFADPAGV